MDTGTQSAPVNKMVLISIIDADFNVHTVQFTNVSARATLDAIDLINDETEGQWLS